MHGIRITSFETRDPGELRRLIAEASNSTQRAVLEDELAIAEFHPLSKPF